MTSEKKQKISDEEIETLQKQLSILKDLQDLKDEATYRYQVLLNLERIARALESVASEPQEVPSDDSSLEEKKYK